MVIEFGQYSGKKIEEIKDVNYLFRLATDYRMGAVKIPDNVALAARATLKARGYRFIGNRLEYDGPVEGGQSAKPQPGNGSAGVAAGDELCAAAVNWKARKELEGRGHTASPTATETTGQSGSERVRAGQSGSERVRAGQSGSKHNENEEGKDMTKIEGRTNGAKVPCKNGCGSLAVKDGLCTKCWRSEHDGKAPYKRGVRDKASTSGRPAPLSIAEGFGSRVRALREAMGYGTRVLFAKAIGVDNTSFGRLEGDTGVLKEMAKTSLIEKICGTFPVVRREWLIDGAGEMLHLDDADDLEKSLKAGEGSEAPIKDNIPASSVGEVVHCQEVSRRFVISDIEHRRAIIVFEAANDDGPLRFKDCTLDIDTGNEGNQGTTVDDWMFIGLVSKQVQRLAATVGGR
jgi:hypothetical protein